ncbi:ABC transporter permease [Lederbergia citrea]|uniref:ABC transporter permease n=1 Tax=Lederbergia citrea TaxID=2833581 RepID=A0A942UWI9_9BACI|nr:ABC transporter permease [Lederbergia citrea]MBS4178845.1 ABC transporter permease [Lederbergia citrea]MBS4224139.1 ABC transporter permease [Lederbergia citrea]
MELLMKAYEYLIDNHVRFLEELQVHLILSFSALILGLIICVPLGIWCAKTPKVAATIMNTVNSIRVIPSLAILVIMLPLIGTGFWPALVALTVLACPPILINTFLGFRGIDPAILESANGMGMSERTVLRKIEFPLAMPLMITGAKTSSVEVLASASLAAFIGGGGLGTFIINGLSMYKFQVLLVGAIPIALLTIFSEVIFSCIEKLTTRYQRDA